MAFSTIQGSGGAPDSFVGTSGVDTIGIVNSTGNFFLGAQQSADVVNIITSGVNDPGLVSNATLKGGQGNDNFSFTNGFNAVLASGVFFNGNSDVDTFTFTGGTLLGSTLQGGQGGDNITTGAVLSSLVNGNKDADTITVNGASSTSSVFGGQGNDTINLTAAVTSSVVSGDDNNDAIATVGAISLAATTLNGAAGNDTINIATAATGAVVAGGDDNDALTGSAFADTVDGGAGTDTIDGNGGADVLTGGAGADQFLVDNGDSGQTTTTAVTITDYVTGTDVIAATGTLAAIALGAAVPGPPAVGTAALSAAGLATFNAADSTFNQRVTAVAAAFTVNGDVAGEAAVFNGGSSNATYLMIGDGVGGVTAGDYIVKLDGVTANTGIGLTAGAITSIS